MINILLYDLRERWYIAGQGLLPLDSLLSLSLFFFLVVRVAILQVLACAYSSYCVFTSRVFLAIRHYSQKLSPTSK